jgi:hypothetical protein
MGSDHATSGVGDRPASWDDAAAVVWLAQRCGSTEYPALQNRPKNRLNLFEIWPTSPTRRIGKDEPFQFIEMAHRRG